MADIVDRGYVVVGSPDDVAEQLREVATTLNVGHFMLLLQFGNMSKELTKYNSKLFADKVMPKLKPLFSEWEDKWWPQPMDTARRATVPAYQPKFRLRNDSLPFNILRPDRCGQAVMAYRFRYDPCGVPVKNAKELR